MKFLFVVVAVIAAHGVDCQSNIGLPPPTVDTPEARQESDGGVRQDFYPPAPVVQQQQEKMSAEGMVFHYENFIEERRSCPGDQFSLPGSRVCYKRISEIMSWKQGKFRCASEGLVLARAPESIAVALRQYIWDNYGYSGVWVDARGNGVSMVWNHDGSAVNQELAVSQNDMLVGREYCLLLTLTETSLEVWPNQPYASGGCDAEQNVLCQSKEQAPCVDHNEACKRWADRGECYINPMYMMVYCKLSCNACVDCPCGCGPGTCTGPNKCDCPSPYQQVGYTCLNPANFNKCLNYNIYCDAWANRDGGCDGTNMKIFCKKACNLSPCVVNTG